MHVYQPPATPFRMRCQTARLRGLPFAAWYDPAMAAELGFTTAAPLKNLLEVLVNPETPITDTLKKDRYCTVYAVEAEGRVWVVKIHHSRPGKTRALQIIHRSHAWREWRGAQKSAKTEARIVYPLALLDGPDPDAYTQVLIFPFIQAEVMTVWQKREPPESQWSDEHRAYRLDLARRVGLSFARFTRNGLVNRDLKATNIMLDYGTLHEGMEPVIIDLDGVKPRYYETKVLKMMRILYITTKDFGHITEDEVTACLRSILEHDPSIAKGQKDREAYIREKVNALMT